MAPSIARPFLKWAGGKTQLLPVLSKIIPQRIQTYYEPFLGGGAVFFHLASNQRFQRAVLNDWNQELVDCYRAVSDFPDELISRLNEHIKHDWNTREYFEGVRAQRPENLDPITRAARTIYLNKTCFNGLFRVNSSGGFNAPFGRYKNPGLFNDGNIRACSQVLNQLASLYSGDFSAILDNATAGDTVYFDPPYVPLSDTSNFASYTSKGFTVDDQHRLAVAFKQLASRGVTVILSNSDTPIVRSLYSEFTICSVQAKRHINSKADRRGPVGEVVVVGGQEEVITAAVICCTPLSPEPAPSELAQMNPWELCEEESVESR